MIDQLQRASRALHDGLADADPDLVSAAIAADIVEEAAEVKRQADAVILLYATRASQSLRWSIEGHKSAASWMAETTKSSVGEAMAVLQTSEALPGLPETTEALRVGELSFTQTRQIAPAALAHPEAEAQLLKAAAVETVKGLKDACARVRAVRGSAEAELEAYNAIRKSRYVRTWTDLEGAFRLDAKLTPDAGAKLKASLQAEADGIFEKARKKGEREAPDAYRADALVALVSGDARSRARRSSGDGSGSGSPGPTVHLRVDAAALRRGHTRLGEVCDIAGVGPVAVAVARRQLSDAALKYFAVRGTDVLSVCHVGRTVPAHVQSALEERDPMCVVPGCQVATGLENHHWETGYADCKTTSVTGLARVCSFHHDLITYDGYVLEGGPGKWLLRSPPDADPFDTS